MKLERFLVFHELTTSKRQLERPRCTREYNIKIDLEDIEYVVVGSIHLARDRVQWRSLVLTVLNFWVS